MQIRLTQHTPRPPLDSVFVTCSLYFEELSRDVCLTVSLYYTLISLKRVEGRYCERCVNPAQHTSLVTPRLQYKSKRYLERYIMV